MGPYRKDMILGMLLVIIESSFEMVIPVLMSDIIDTGVAQGDVPAIMTTGLQMAACAVLALITGLLYARYAARASYGFGARIREAEYAKVQEYAFANLDHFETSSLITRMTTDVTVLQNAINGGFRPLVRGPSMLVLGIALAFFMSPELSVVFFICTPVLGAVLFLVVRHIAPMYIRLQQAMDHLNNVVQECLTAIRAVKAFVRGEYEEEKFEAVNTELMQVSRSTFRTAVLNLPALPADDVRGLRVDPVAWRHDDLERRADRRPSDQLFELCHAGHELADDDLQRLSAHDPLARSAHRVAQVLDERVALTSPENAVTEIRTAASALKNVSFKYHPDARRVCAGQHRPDHPPGPDRRYPGRHRLGQVDAGAADPAPVRRHRGPRACRRAGCARIRPSPPCATPSASCCRKTCSSRHRAREPAVGRPHGR